MRERIEKGEHADLFTSADIGHARKLVDEGRAAVMAVFVRNAVCGRVDASIVYCSGRDRYARLLPDASLVAFPPELRVGPEYALAVLEGAHPAATMLALTILSPAGQRTMADRGFRPVTLPSE